MVDGMRLKQGIGHEWIVPAPRSVPFPLLPPGRWSPHATHGGSVVSQAKSTALQFTLICIRKMSIQAYRTVSSPSIRQHTWWTLRLQTGCCWSLTDGLWSRDRRASLQRRTRGEMMKGGCHHPPDDEGGRFNWPTHVLGTSWPESPVWDCVRTNPHITCLGVPEPLNALTQGHTTTGRIYIDLLCPASLVLNRPTATLGRDSVHVMKN